MLINISAKAQKWQPGHFTDIKGNKQSGFIRVNPSGKGPVKDEGFIEFKDDEKGNPYKLSASDLQSLVAGKDSFVVAHAPRNESWSKREIDFVKVELDESLKLYVTKGGNGGGSGFSISPNVGVGIGGGSYGSYGGGGVGISLGGGNGGNSKTTYYFGVSTDEMHRLTNDNFNDIMSDIMGDEPQAVDAIKSGKYNLGNIDKLIIYFKELQASHKN